MKPSKKQENLILMYDRGFDVYVSNVTRQRLIDDLGVFGIEIPRYKDDTRFTKKVLSMLLMVMYICYKDLMDREVG